MASSGRYARGSVLSASITYAGIAFLISTNASSGVYSSPCAEATASYVQWPANVLTPAFKPASAAIAEKNPLLASFSAYGRVAFVRAKVDVRGTAPGIFATQ